MENIDERGTNVHKMLEFLMSIASIAVTVVSIIVTVISIRQNAKKDRHQKSNRSKPKE